MDPRTKSQDAKVKVAVATKSDDVMTLGVVVFVVSILGLLLGRTASGM